MPRLLVAAVIAVAACGCAPGPYGMVAPTQQVAPYYGNPTLLRTADHQYVWETVVDVVDDYFKVVTEEPVRQIGEVLTEGRLETVPQISPTVLEPWRRDTAGGHDRLENTLQSMRRRAVVRVLPAQRGYWVDVAVLKELEDLPKPQHATAGAATFRYDDSLRRVVNPVGDAGACEGWIPQGRDVGLEQEILAHLHARTTRPNHTFLSPRR